VGTEARDMTDDRWGGCATYRPFWIMRWLGQIGGEKCGGGWYDPYGTHADTYLEQARQTILGGARESLLFCYPSLLRDTGPENITALRRELPALFDLAAWVKGEEPRGVVSYRPMNAPAGEESYIFDWLGMVGLPVIPAHEFPGEAQVALFSVHARHDPEFAARARAFLEGGGHAIFTASAAGTADIRAGQGNVHVFEPPGDTRRIMELPAEEITALRAAALAPLGIALDGPVAVSLYLFGDRKVVLESFSAEETEMRVRIPDAESYRVALALGPPGAAAWSEGGSLHVRLPPRSLVALER
jgi:hypothetical protein